MKKIILCIIEAIIKYLIILMIYRIVGRCIHMDINLVNAGLMSILVVLIQSDIIKRADRGKRKMLSIVAVFLGFSIYVIGMLILGTEFSLELCLEALFVAVIMMVYEFVIGKAIQKVKLYNNKI